MYFFREIKFFTSLFRKLQIFLNLLWRGFRKMAKKTDNRLNQLREICAKVDADKAAVIEPLLTDVVFMEERLKELRKLPQIEVSSKNKAVQRITAAGKQYKETMQAYLNALKVVQTTLSRFTVEEADAFDKWLQEARGE